MVFFEKWLRNHPKFLLHFLIHIDVLMLCRKFELIPTSIFQVMSIRKYIHTINTILHLYMRNTHCLISFIPILTEETDP